MWPQHSSQVRRSRPSMSFSLVAVDTLECLGGTLPKAQQRLVEAWAEIHRAELHHDWGLCNPASHPSRSSHSGRPWSIQSTG
jgi:Domain of unknown function (DUF4160)